MKHIGIDCRFGNLSVGLGRYTREIVSALLARKDPVRFTLFVRSEEEEWLTGLSRDTVTILHAPFPHYSLAEQIRFPSLIKKSKIDLLFCPHFSAPLLCPCPLIVTIHDLILHHYPNTASPLKAHAYRFLVQRTVKKAIHRITVSSFTAKELQNTYGHSVLPLTTIKEGVSHIFFPRSPEECQRVLEKYNIDQPYFLYVGNNKQHKNVQTLITAFEKAHSLTHALVLVTGGREAENLPRSPYIHIIPHLSDDELSCLYSAAESFVTASLYEGFCLPAHEALACGCPVIASNRTALADYLHGKEGVQLIEPTSFAFAEAMISPPRVLQHEVPLRWEDSAEKTISVFKEVLKV